MHSLLYFKTQPSEEQIRAEIAMTLDGKYTESPLEDVYVVQLADNTEWKELVSALQVIGAKYPQRLQFILTPLMEGGTYDGWIPKHMWPKLNAISGAKV